MLRTASSVTTLSGHTLRPLAAGPRRYELRALVEHRGRGARSGHYVAAVQGADGRFTLQNDERLGVPLADDAVRNLEAFLLFYEAADG